MGSAYWEVEGDEVVEMVEDAEARWATGRDIERVGMGFGETVRERVRHLGSTEWEMRRSVPAARIGGDAGRLVGDVERVGEARERRRRALLKSRLSLSLASSSHSAVSETVPGMSLPCSLSFSLGLPLPLLSFFARSSLLSLPRSLCLPRSFSSRSLSSRSLSSRSFCLYRSHLAFGAAGWGTSAGRMFLKNRKVGRVSLNRVWPVGWSGRLRVRVMEGARRRRVGGTPGMGEEREGLMEEGKGEVKEGRVSQLPVVIGARRGDVAEAEAGWSRKGVWELRSRAGRVLLRVGVRGPACKVAGVVGTGGGAGGAVGSLGVLWWWRQLQRRCRVWAGVVGGPPSSGGGEGDVAVSMVRWTEGGAEVGPEVWAEAEGWWCASHPLTPVMVC